jgi:hypothetical protein
MPHVPENVIGIFSANKRAQIVKSKIRLGLPFMVPDLVLKLTRGSQEPVSFTWL